MNSNTSTLISYINHSIAGLNVSQITGLGLLCAVHSRIAEPYLQILFLLQLSISLLIPVLGKNGHPLGQVVVPMASTRHFTPNDARFLGSQPPSISIQTTSNSINARQCLKVDKNTQKQQPKILLTRGTNTAK